MPLIRTVKFLARRVERFFIYRVLSLDDTPHRIALGVAVGIFVTWLPAMGLQMILTVAISGLLRANKFVGVPFVWISNPLTVVPLYSPNYLVGCWILGGDFSRWSTLVDAFAFQGSWFHKLRLFWTASLTLFSELWLGSLIVGAVLGTITYFVIRRAVVLFRRRLHRRHARATASGDSAERR